MQGDAIWDCQQELLQQAGSSSASRERPEPSLQHEKGKSDLKIYRANRFSKNMHEGQWQGSGGPQLGSGRHFQPQHVTDGF